MADEPTVTLIFENDRKLTWKTKSLFKACRDLHSTCNFMRMLMGGPAALMTLQPRPGDKNPPARVKVLTNDRISSEMTFSTA